MNKLLLLSFSLLLLVGCKKIRAPVREPAGAIPPAPQTIGLAWDYPAEELTEGLSFNVYHSSDISVPIRNWQVITNVPAPVLSVNLQIFPGAHFFAITAMRNGIESDFSAVSSQ